MRIIAGKWRGRTIAAPPGDATRPTSDRTREALFSMLASRLGDFEGLRIADLFAGSGALGFEALSRGAAHAIFVEQDRKAVEILRANATKLGAVADIRAQPVATLGPVSQPHDLLLFDPPYGSGGAGALLERLTRLGWASPGAWASIETSRDEPVSATGWSVDAERTHGKAKLTLLRRDAAE
ncbi:16S rRNA (guanine(966)-N(2))-methyltransferase RsmD [Edaphosphingomonas haloaromaticamans]|uniref:Ribosomal RNA small subunit methyltransferase D n=1 Tax=Edaphosphingomonas haloaromaticamans TaxID=653954 RepID=A0A1S1HED3_9SPHN|nr:16S rRNA (guanine(966)-N(2))-methyltransferase RsmD [Sphingomonas haloaromaticamans]OHT20448.1 Ribosomal RNA small subunit methyltransferase D [Sphingomonas haloaromaticamans]